jgi:hypothetical protein
VKPHRIEVIDMTERTRSEQAAEFRVRLQELEQEVATVRAAWHAAPAGPGKDAAGARLDLLSPYVAAQRAQLGLLERAAALEAHDAEKTADPAPAGAEEATRAYLELKAERWPEG